MMERTVAYQKPIQSIKLKGGKNLMKKRERRCGKEQRSGVDRRKFNDPNYKEPESRSGRDKRFRKDRRKSKQKS
jgi:hypothetical protein